MLTRAICRRHWQFGENKEDGNHVRGREYRACHDALSTGPRLLYAERGNPTGKPSSSSTATPTRGSPIAACSPCSQRPTTRSRSPSADTGTRISSSAATRPKTSPPMSMRSWTRSASKKRPSSELRRGPLAQRVALSYPRRVSRLVLVGPQTPANESVMGLWRRCVRWKILSRPSSSESSRRAPSTSRFRKSSSIRWSQRVSSSRPGYGATIWRRRRAFY